MSFSDMDANSCGDSDSAISDSTLVAKHFPHVYRYLRGIDL